MSPADGDTAVGAAAEQRRLLMMRTPDERVAMMAAMCRDAISIVESRLVADGILEPGALRAGAFRQMYASDFDAPTLERIASRIAAAAVRRS